MNGNLTPAMLRELRAIKNNQGDGNVSDPADWQHAPEGLWWHAREKVITALKRRALVNDDNCLTDAGKAALESAQA